MDAETYRHELAILAKVLKERLIYLDPEYERPEITGGICAAIRSGDDDCLGEIFIGDDGAFAVSIFADQLAAKLKKSPPEGN